MGVVNPCVGLYLIRYGIVLKPALYPGNTYLHTIHDATPPPIVYLVNLKVRVGRDNSPTGEVHPLA